MKLFGVLPDGREVYEYTFANSNGIEVSVINYGGIITAIKTPDKQGNVTDVVLGYDTLQAYIDNNPYFGALIGRYGNRIAKGKFTLDDTEYTLATNNIGNHLHGGLVGFDKVYWNIETFGNADGVGVVLSYTSKDMEEGYPGNLEVEVTYLLKDDNSLTFDYKAVTDQPTIVNLTQHTYFNFTGNAQSILGHQLMINADSYLPVDSTLIPTGEFRSVEGTPFDFTESQEIGKEIDVDNEQLAIAGGYDHCWVLNKQGKDMVSAANLYEPNSGRFMEVYTTEPGIQFYSGNFLDGSLTGKNGKNYGFRSGLCLETQHYPDSPNQPEFPTVRLNPGEEYRTTTKLIFSVK